MLASNVALAQNNVVAPPPLPQDLPVNFVKEGVYGKAGDYCNPHKGLTLWISQGGATHEGAKVGGQKLVKYVYAISPTEYCLTPDCNCFAYKKDANGKNIPGSRYRKWRSGGGRQQTTYIATKASGWTTSTTVSTGVVSGGVSYNNTQTEGVSVTFAKIDPTDKFVQCGQVRYVRAALVKDTVRQFQVARRGVCIPAGAFEPKASIGIVAPKPFASDEIAYTHIDKYAFQGFDDKPITCALAKKQGLYDENI